MAFLAALKSVLRRGTASFNELEHAVLTALVNKLPPDVQRRLQERIKRVDLVQRLDGGREVNCYVMRGGKSELDPDTRVDTTTGERLFAKFRIDGNKMTENAGAVWWVDGNLFSLQFESPTEHSEATRISAISIELV